MQISKITSLKELIQRGDRADFSGLFSIDREVSLARRGGMLSIPELAKIKKFTAATERIRKYIKKYTEEYPALKEEHTDWIRPVAISRPGEDGDCSKCNRRNDNEEHPLKFLHAKSIALKIAGVKQNSPS